MWGRSDAVDLGPHPSARFGAAVAHSRDYGVLFGGTNGRQMFNETFLILPGILRQYLFHIESISHPLSHTLTHFSQSPDGVVGIQMAHH
jgi:hypothetical protein